MSESPSCYTATTPKANKRHRCCECSGFIEVGETYHRFSGIWCGEADTFKTCSDCEALRSKVIKECKLHFDEIPAFGQLYEDIDGIEDTKAFVAIMERRGVKVGQSWYDQIQKLLTPPASAQPHLPAQREALG